MNHWKQTGTLIAGIIGLLVGVYTPEIAEQTSLLGEIFVRLLKMMIVPIVSVSVFLAVAQRQLLDLSKIGSKTFKYYLFTSTCACLTGLVAAMFLNTGELATPENIKASKLSALSFGAFVKSFISQNPFAALAEGKVVQIVLLALFLGAAATTLPYKTKKPLLDVTHAIDEIVSKGIDWILLFMPFGVCSLIATTVAKTDFSIFTGLQSFFILTSAAVIFHLCITLPTIAWVWGRFNAFKLYGQVYEALLTALSSASSSATLPVSRRVLEENSGVKPETTSFVLPLGATLNMDGSALYQALVVILLSKFANIDLSIAQMFTVFIFVMISSAGSAGIPSGGMLMVGAILEMIGIPLHYLGIYVLVDRFWDYIITVVNVAGDLVGTKIIDLSLDKQSS